MHMIWLFVTNIDAITPNIAMLRWQAAKQKLRPSRINILLSYNANICLVQHSPSSLSSFVPFIFFLVFFTHIVFFCVCSLLSQRNSMCLTFICKPNASWKSYIWTWRHGGGGGQFFSDVSNLFLFGMEVLEFFYHLTAKEVNNSSAHSTYCSTTSEKTITGKTEEKQTQREITIKYSPWYVLITMHPFRFQATHSADHYHW